MQLVVMELVVSLQISTKTYWEKDAWTRSQ